MNGTAWICYVLAFAVLYVVGINEAAVILFAIGILCHWKYWIKGIVLCLFVVLGYNVTRD